MGRAYPPGVRIGRQLPGFGAYGVVPGGAPCGGAVCGGAPCGGAVCGVGAAGAFALNLVNNSHEAFLRNGALVGANNSDVTLTSDSTSTSSAKASNWQVERRSLSLLPFTKKLIDLSSLISQFDEHESSWSKPRSANVYGSFCRPLIHRCRTSGAAKLSI